MGEDIGSVKFEEPFSISVGKFLLSKGFVLATSWGMALSELVANDSIGVLYRDPEAKPRKYLFGLIIVKQRRIFLGTVWFHNAARGANSNSWAFEIRGRKYVDLAKKLAGEMAKKFCVEVNISLLSEGTETESFLSDYDD